MGRRSLCNGIEIQSGCLPKMGSFMPSMAKDADLQKGQPNRICAEKTVYGGEIPDVRVFNEAQN